ncbi:MAG: hypothetical protein ACFFCR_14280, partial [Promethearchaeota archaeon]
VHQWRVRIAGLFYAQIPSYLLIYSPNLGCAHRCPVEAMERMNLRHQIGVLGIRGRQAAR